MGLWLSLGLCLGAGVPCLGLGLWLGQWLGLGLWLLLGLWLVLRPQGLCCGFVCACGLWLGL